jgi:hypothetical protein
MTGLFFRSLRSIVLLGTVALFGMSTASARADYGCYEYGYAPTVRCYSPPVYCEPAPAFDGYAGDGYSHVYSSGSAYWRHNYEPSQFYGHRSSDYVSHSAYRPTYHYNQSYSHR